MNKYAIGLDYGTNSCRSLIVDLSNGKEVADFVFNYPSGHQGVLTDASDPNVARQSPKDYLQGLETIIVEGMKAASKADSDFSSEKVIAIGIDTTGSTPIPVNAEGTPLALLPEFECNLNAEAWLWKDHTSFEEAEKITSVAKKMRPEYLAKCGGIYSSEWFWAKILHLKNIDKEVFDASYSFVEMCDYLPAVLAGNTKPEELVRSVCAAGHKAFYNEDWGGLPDKEFLAALDPDLVPLRDRLYSKAYPSDHSAGTLCAEWATKLGLSEGIDIAVGAFDCHMGAVGAGGKEGSLFKILGTSTCDIMLSDNSKPLADIPGVCGIVDGSVQPGYFGIEAGQSAVGDIFLWFVNNIVPEKYGKDNGEKFAKLDEEASKLSPGESGLLALDWNNGNRTVLVDPLLTGLMLGQTLHTTADEIYRALIEATAFGAYKIIKRVEEYNVPVNEVITCGGLSVKCPLLMQIYADVFGKPIKVSDIDQTCAFGAAIFGAVVAGKDKGGFDDVLAAQEKMCVMKDLVYTPIAENQKVYAELFALYDQLHDGFGTAEWSGEMNNVMKDLIAIRQQQRKA